MIWDRRDKTDFDTEVAALHQLSADKDQELSHLAALVQILGERLASTQAAPPLPTTTTALAQLDVRLMFRDFSVKIACICRKVLKHVFTCSRWKSRSSGRITVRRGRIPTI